MSILASNFMCKLSIVWDLNDYAATSDTQLVSGGSNNRSKKPSSLNSNAPPTKKSTIVFEPCSRPITEGSEPPLSAKLDQHLFSLSDKYVLFE